MNSGKFITMPLSEKKRIVKSVIRAANKEQKAIMTRYRTIKPLRKGSYVQ